VSSDAHLLGCEDSVRLNEVTIPSAPTNAGSVLFTSIYYFSVFVIKYGQADQLNHG
jgi:hypothetical protein